MAAHAGIKSAAESARLAKVLGSSLQCSVVLEISDPKVASVLEQFGDELAAMFVVSSVEINIPIPHAEWKFTESFNVSSATGTPDSPVQCTAVVLPPKQSKCPRCWRYVAPKEDELCHRCEHVVQETPL